MDTNLHRSPMRRPSYTLKYFKDACEVALLNSHIRIFDFDSILYKIFTIVYSVLKKKKKFKNFHYCLSLPCVKFSVFVPFDL